MQNLTQHLVTLYTRTPLHVGCGTSVDVVDLPIMRERITGFPVIPGSSLKGVLRDQARHASPEELTMLFGDDSKDGSKFAGCVQTMEAKLLAFPVRSLAGCFAWLTCPAVLERFQRDTGKSFDIPPAEKDKAIAGAELIVNGKVVFEEYAMATKTADIAPVVGALKPLTSDPLWQDRLDKRLAIVHDEDFQHFVSACTEVVARIVIDPATRTNQNLFYQENVPCETLFYTVLTVLPSRRADGQGPEKKLADLLANTRLLQLGGDETTGHGLCEVRTQQLNG